MLSERDTWILSPSRLPDHDLPCRFRLMPMPPRFVACLLYSLLYISFVLALSADAGCKKIGGSCLDWRHHKCIAGYQTGLCSGDKNRRCCKSCDDACTGKEASYSDIKCKSNGGTCMDNSNYCPESYLSGHCAGPAGRQCCTKESAATSADFGCTSIGGSCLDWRHHKCIAGYESGLCSGDKSRRCCKPCDDACIKKEASYSDSKCKSKGGTCMDNSNYCAESYLPEHCGGPAGRQCCTNNSAASSADSGCTSIGGNCLDWRHHKCIAGYVAGLCSGDSNRRCCKPCDDACTRKEASYCDSKCKSKGGTCMDNSNYCAGRYLSKHCNGPAGRQCCTKNAAVATVINYSGQWKSITEDQQPPKMKKLCIFRTGVYSCETEAQSPGRIQKHH